MGIIGALYERARCRSQQEIPRGRQPWNPTLQKTRGAAPGRPNAPTTTIEEVLDTNTYVDKAASVAAVTVRGDLRPAVRICLERELLLHGGDRTSVEFCCCIPLAIHDLPDISG